MRKYWKLIAHVQEEGTTYAAAAGALQPSGFTPYENSRLVGVRVMPARTAATTLLDGKQIKISCATFNPNSIEFAVVGSGLQTAPASQPNAYDFACDQPCAPGNAFTVESRGVNASEVTVDILVMGCFEAG